MSHTRSLMLVVLVALSASACSLFPRPVPDTTTTVTLRVEDPNGGAPAGAPGSALADILRRRLDLAGFHSVSVEAVDAQNLRITVAGAHKQPEFDGLVGFGRLAFRKVVDSTAAPTVVARSGVPSAQPPVGPLTPTQADVVAKLGPAAAVAAQLTAPPTGASVLAALAPFGTLTPAEVAVLPARTQFLVPLISCPTLAARPAGTIDDPGGAAVACDEENKYLLDAARVVGADVQDARAAIDPQGGRWIIELSFTGTGQPKWTALTQEAVDPGACRAPVDNHCQVAIVVDNTVVSAPSIQGVITAGAEISGAFTAATAKALAAQIGGGVVPYRLTIVDVSIITSK